MAALVPSFRTNPARKGSFRQAQTHLAAGRLSVRQPHAEMRRVFAHHAPGLDLYFPSSSLARSRWNLASSSASLAAFCTSFSMFMQCFSISMAQEFAAPLLRSG